MISAFGRMAKGILDRLGEDAFFDGAITPIKINIEHGVQVQDDGDQNLVVERSVATLAVEVGARSGKTFVQNGRTWKLQHRVNDNGVTQRYVVIEITL